jgi:hydrogenase maturation protease
MNRAYVDRIVDAVLYEGYILYPYRLSVKNRQRWTFGGLYPEGGHDASSNQTAVLVCGGPATVIEATVRFLHLTNRLVGEPALPFRPVESLQVGDRVLHTWQEAEERQVVLGEVVLGERVSHPFTFAGGRREEPVPGSSGEVAALLVREQRAVEGVVEAEAVEVHPGLFRLSVRVTNRTPRPGPMERDEALLHALVSAHTVLDVREGEFVSLLDPPEDCRDAAASCHNVGTWPVLVGAEGERTTMLSSPIILYDYPQLAPESPGDFFDATEIDEMLTLRILTMTDEEKREMAAVDERAAALLARTQSLAREQLLGLHGTVRGLKVLESRL